MTEAALLRIVGSLTLVVIAILVMAWIARRTGLAQGKTHRSLKIISSQRLGTRSHITIVQIEDTHLVLGVTPTQINVLHTLPAPDGAHSESDTASTQTRNDPTERSRLSFRRMLDRKLAWLLSPILLGLALWPDLSYAQAMLPALTAGPAGIDGSQTWSLSVQTLMLLTMMSFLPAMLLTMTGFTRIIIVLGLLRNAMGTGASPPNSVLVGLALFLTFFAMSPVFDQVYSTAWQPLSDGRIAFEEALSLGVEPLREFMLHQTRETDLSLFANMANLPDFETPDQVPLRVLVPAFVTSELKTAFQIGFTIFIPFLIIDLVIASILMSLGMMMVPPVTISLPFKLMLFVLADGWHLLLGSLARSFYQ